VGQETGRARPLAPDLPQQQFAGGLAQLVAGLAHRGEHGPEHGGVLHVVKAHHRQVLGDPQAPLLRRPDGPQGQHVGDAEEGRGPVLPVQKLPRRPDAREEGVVLIGESLQGLDVRPSEDGLAALPPLAGGNEVVGGAHKADLAVAQGEEVFRHLLRRGAVVDGHVADGLVGAVFAALHHRELRRRRRDHLGVQRRVQKDGPVGPAVMQQF